MGLDWEKANKRDLIAEKGSIDKEDGLPGKYSPKKKKPYKFRMIKAKFSTSCAECSLPIKFGEEIKYYLGPKVATHTTCNLKGLI